MGSVIDPYRYHKDHFSVILNGDNQEVLPLLAENSFDSVVTDPPYELGVFGEKWDNTGIAYDPEAWRKVYRVLKPGGYMVAFGGSRTFHRILCAIEDAGFEVRDVLLWMYANGFPKGTNVSVAIDRKLGHKRETIMSYDGNVVKGQVWVDQEPITEEAAQWKGWNTTLKPTYEPIALVRKPMIGTIVENIQEHGTGALNIDATRVKRDKAIVVDEVRNPKTSQFKMKARMAVPYTHWYTSNAIVDESAVEMFDGAPRFFYTPKASVRERRQGLQYNETKPNHTTVKPVDLMCWLVKLVTRPGGTVLDPFTGSGSTRLACHAEGMKFVGIELSEEYCRIASERG